MFRLALLALLWVAVYFSVPPGSFRQPHEYYLPEIDKQIQAVPAPDIVVVPRKDMIMVRKFIDADQEDISRARTEARVLFVACLALSVLGTYVTRKRKSPGEAEQTPAGDSLKAAPEE